MNELLQHIRGLINEWESGRGHDDVFEEIRQAIDEWFEGHNEVKLLRP